jgi:hypothetical protein
VIDLHPHFWTLLALFLSGAALTGGLLIALAIALLPDRPGGAHARNRRHPRRHWPDAPDLSGDPYQQKRAPGRRV